MARRKEHHLELRGNIWHFVASLNHKRIKRSLSTSSLTDARKLRDAYLKDIRIYGEIPGGQSEASNETLFGEVAQKWALITEKKVKTSTMIDYRSAMNFYILPRFGNTPIADMTYMDIETFVSELECSAKRINNILVPLRSVFKMAYKGGLIDKNIMLLVENRRTVKPQIHPLSIDEVKRFLEAVDPFYKPFFITAIFTGMRGGEMAALKWENVDLDKKIIKITETRVYGEEGMPKTKSSYRTIDLLPMVCQALKDQAACTRLKSSYVFLNAEGTPVDVETLRPRVWSKGLKNANIDYRPMIQTRHTFATLMISAGENLGWVQKMMGHTSLKMIFENYYAYIPNFTHQDGSRFVREYEKKLPDVHQNYTRQESDLLSCCN